MPNTVSATISDETLSRIIHIESGGRTTAKAGTSSAAGLGQFLNGTWLTVVNKHRPKWAIGKSSSELLALNTASPCSRFHGPASIEMLARFTEDNAAILGPGYSDGDLYLAHFAGVGTARKLLRAPAEAPSTAVFSQAAVAANRSILMGKDCGDVREWANRKMKAAGGRNWVAVYMQGAKATVPPKTKATAGAVVAGGGGAVATATQQGWGALEWAIAAGCAAVVVAAIVAGVIWWRRRNTPVKIEGAI
jgi:hypothetical protein